MELEEEALRLEREALKLEQQNLRISAQTKAQEAKSLRHRAKLWRLEEVQKLSQTLGQKHLPSIWALDFMSSGCITA